MPRGIYKRHKKNLPAVIQPEVQKSGQFGEYPLDLIPDPVRPAAKSTRPTMETALLSLCHRLMDQQDKLLDVALLKPKRPYKKRKGVKQ